jgi:hypothetical protein
MSAQSISFDNTSYDGTAAITGYTGTDTDVVIPAYVTGVYMNGILTDNGEDYLVTDIGLYGNENKAGFSLPNTVETVTCPDSTEVINPYAFLGATSLIAVPTMPEGTFVARTAMNETAFERPATSENFDATDDYVYNLAFNTILTYPITKLITMDLEPQELTEINGKSVVSMEPLRGDAHICFVEDDQAGETIAYIVGENGVSATVTSFLEFLLFDNGYSGHVVDLKWIDLRYFEVNPADPEVLEFECLFLKNRSDLEHLDLTGWDFSRATSIAGLFENTAIPPDFNWNRLDFSNVENTSSMFAGASFSGVWDIRRLSFASVTNYDDMFTDVSGLTSVLVGTQEMKDFLITAGLDASIITIVP